VNRIIASISSLTLILIASAAIAPAAAQVSFTASADRTTASRGDRATVVATLVSPKPVSGAPSAQSDAFDVLGVNTGQSQSHSVNIVNGKIEQKREIIYKYIYTISPRTDGAFTFPALTVNIDGATYRTRPIGFNGAGAGDAGADGSGGGGAAANSGGAGGEPVQPPDIRAFLSISKKAIYPGEQATLTLKIAQRANAPIQTQRGYMSALEQIEKAFAPGFSLNRLFTNQVTQGQENIGGELHNTFTLKFSVFGLTSGEYAIPAISFDYDEIRQTQRRQVNPFFQDFFDMDFFGGQRQAVQKTVRTAPFTVKVLKLPPNAPADFSGSAGKVTLSAEASPQSVAAGEAVTLRITLRGNTRAANVGDPVLPTLKDCDVFTPERQTAVDTGASGFATKKTYRYLIVPKQEGTLTLGPITYPYLDPESGTYKTARSDTIRIAVTKGTGGPKEQTRYLTQEEILQVGSDIRYIKTPQKIARQAERPYRAPYWYLLFPTPFLLFLIALLYKLHSKRSGENQHKSIRQKALGNAVRELNKAGKGGSDNEFLGRASTVIEKYISHKFAFAATGRTLEELKDELLKRKIDEQAVTGLTVLIESINEYRFGGKAFDTQSRSVIINDTVKFLSTMEKSAQKGKAAQPSTTSTALALAMLFAGMTVLISPLAASAAPSAHSANAWFQTANGFYAENSYDSALAYYSKILDAGVKNSALYYNMGNCYYRLAMPGLARLYYEKAAVLEPNDADIKANINFITSIIVDRSADNDAESDFLASILYGIHTLLPLNVQLMAVCALLFALSIICSAMLLKRGLTRLWLAYGAVLCAIIASVIGISAGYKIYAIESKQYAIILAESIDAKNQPSGTQTLFTAHEGTKLQIRKTVGEWSLVNLSNGASGWVNTGALGKI
jgi:tetratricopeptide (TPR) repeat protein